MNRRTHLRNAGFAALTVLVVVLLASQWPSFPVNAQGTTLLEVTPATATASLAPGAATSVTFTIRNNTADTRVISAGFTNLPSGFTFTLQGSLSIPANSSAQANVLVTSTAATQAPGNYGPVTVTFSGAATGTTAVTGTAVVSIQVTGATFTPTPSLTRTVGPPSATPTRGPVCADGFETDNSPASARTIDVNTAQERTICPANDEDWIVFGGVAGKVYTIDVSRMDPGIDLTLELFDQNLNSIAFNDDFFNRDPASPNPGDIKPRITIRIPADGPYYIKVRDAAGRGGVNYFYVIALLDESYGPTPTLVREVCIDLFEPDGLPEQARLLTSNELQEERRLCPSGDADWITFFAKAGKRYIIFTDTRRYVGTNRVNGQTQAGADTVIVLTDRDGVSLIDVNDDIAGGSTLDSQIEFLPEVDGFYFVQIKNVGDIGGQFIRYDLTLLLCLPGQTDCGRGEATAGQPADPITPQPTGTPADEFTLDPTRTPLPTATNTTTP